MMSISCFIKCDFPYKKRQPSKDVCRTRYHLCLYNYCIHLKPFNARITAHFFKGNSKGVNTYIRKVLSPTTLSLHLNRMYSYPYHYCCLDYRPKYEVCQKKNSRINDNVHHTNDFHQNHVLYKSHLL